VTLAARPLLRLVTLALLLGVPSCNTDEPADQGEAGVVKMKIGRETFSLEVADTPKKQQLGLMHRKSMPQDRGMIFVFPEEQERSFWMKNTLIPLDIIYLDAGGKVVSVKQMKPLDESSVPSDGPAKYAVELNQGAAKRAGVAAGDVLTVPEEAREPHSRRRAAAVR
jgi:uncharacterized membrane protein (UPF0127 family)